MQLRADWKVFGGDDSYSSPYAIAVFEDKGFGFRDVSPNPETLNLCVTIDQDQDRDDKTLILISNTLPTSP